MKNLKYYSVIALVVLGCNDKLNQIDPNQPSAVGFYQTQEQAIYGIDAAYNSLIIDGAYNRMTPAMSDGRSDELICRSPWPVLSGVSSFTLPAADVFNGSVWYAYYQMIARANLVLENVPNTTTGADLKNRILGQAYFLRAFAHFQLTLFYDEVPLVTTVPANPSEFYPTTSTKAEIWAQIKADLNTAKDLLPVSYETVTGPDNGQIKRVTKGAALALLGKVHLYNKEYQMAAQLFEQVMALGIYSLAPNYEDNFTNNVAVEQSNPESIFSVVFTTSNGPTLNWGGDEPTAAWRQFLAVSPTYGPPGKGFFDFFPAFWLYTEMRSEKTIDNKLDPRYHATFLSYEPDEGYTKVYGQDWADAKYQPGDFFIKKYTNADLGAPNEFGNNSGIDYQVIRYADVLLMYAECQNESPINNRAKAAEYIQRVRDRANLPDREGEFAGFSQAQMRDQLAHERVMELAIEGQRFYDIQRWGWLQDPAKVALLKARDPEWGKWTPGREYLSIPQRELDLNPNLDPNKAN